MTPTPESAPLRIDTQSHPVGLTIRTDAIPTYNDLMEALSIIGDDAGIGSSDAVKVLMALDDAGLWIVRKPASEPER